MNRNDEVRSTSPFRMRSVGEIDSLVGGPFYSNPSFVLSSPIGCIGILSVVVDNEKIPAEVIIMQKSIFSGSGIGPNKRF